MEAESETDKLNTEKRKEVLVPSIVEFKPTLCHVNKYDETNMENEDICFLQNTPSKNNHI